VVSVDVEEDGRPLGLSSIVKPGDSGHTPHPSEPTHHTQTQTQTQDESI